MRRLFWFGLGAGAGYFAATRGGAAIDRARERGVVGNVALAAGTATRLAQSAARGAASAGAAADAGTAAPSPQPRTAREVRP